MKIKPSWDETESLSRNARGNLPLMAGEFRAAGHEAVKPGTPARDLHAFRLKTKRFRYTLELFRPLYGATLDQIIESLRYIQGYLGDVNDCEVSRRLVLKTGSRRSPQVRQVLHLLDTRQEEKLQALQLYWDTRVAPQEVGRRWVNYLAVYPGRTRGGGAARAKAGQPPQSGADSDSSNRPVRG